MTTNMCQCCRYTRLLSKRIHHLSDKHTRLLSVRPIYPKYHKNELLCQNHLLSLNNTDLHVKELSSSSYSNSAITPVENKVDTDRLKLFKRDILDGPSLGHFITESSDRVVHKNPIPDSRWDIRKPKWQEKGSVPYVPAEAYAGSQRKVYFETYGCQMNVNDTEIAWSILKDNGFQKTSDIKESDVVLLVTCSVREGAEKKIWNRLEYLKFLKRKRRRQRSKPPLKIGILGCMAERLKENIIEKEQMVDLICGPDAYKDLPRMLSVTETGQTAVNVLLSLDETYADVVPVRLNSMSTSAYVSIMRGCDNMCTYCIVPFTRGRERSRPINSILDEVRSLSHQGIKEVTLLGQNVNSYCDRSETSYGLDLHSIFNMSRGFSTVYKPKTGGRRFIDLLDKVSQIDPQMRIRFTSPHPKDFPDQVLQLIKERENVCSQLHLPAQSGSSRVLEAMGRGYTREAYLDLVHNIRQILPDVSLSSDFISGFCGETEEDHQETLSLIRHVQFNFAYSFPYSMRQKTRAFHRLEDDVPLHVKTRRQQEVVNVFRKEAERRNRAQIGHQQLVLIEGLSKRSSSDVYGRNDANTKVILPRVDIPIDRLSGAHRPMTPGDYTVVQINEASSQVLKGTPLYHSTLTDFTKERADPYEDYNLELAV